MERRVGPGHPRMYLSFVISLVRTYFFFFGARGRFFCLSLLVVGGPTMTGKAGLVPGKRLYVKQLLPTASAAAEPLPWPFGPHVAG
jgi:hypothetical protein